MPKHIDAHVYAPGNLRPEKRRVIGCDAAAVMHIVAKDRSIPGSAIVKLVDDGTTVAMFAVIPKGPVRVNDRDAELLIRERDYAKRARMLAEVVRSALCRG